jgi:ribonucleoside-diphosphate reductase alpha chain
MSERERLPNRRAAEMFDFEHGGRKWSATISRFPDGRVAEIFLDTPKLSAIGEFAAEVAIVASLALQSGCPLETLQHAIEGRDAGPLGAALATIGGPAS